MMCASLKKIFRLILIAQLFLSPTLSFGEGCSESLRNTFTTYFQKTIMRNIRNYLKQHLSSHKIKKKSGSECIADILITHTLSDTKITGIDKCVSAKISYPKNNCLKPKITLRIYDLNLSGHLSVNTIGNDCVIGNWGAKTTLAEGKVYNFRKDGSKPAIEVTITATLDLFASHNYGTAKLHVDSVNADIGTLEFKDEGGWVHLQALMNEIKSQLKNQNVNSMIQSKLKSDLEGKTYKFHL